MIMIFGLGKPAQGGVAGLVGEPIELEGIDKNKTVGWMNRWAAYAVTDNSLMGDEFGECRVTSSAAARPLPAAAWTAAARNRSARQSLSHFNDPFADPSVSMGSGASG